VHVALLPTPPEPTAGAARRRRRLNRVDGLGEGQAQAGGDGTAARPCPPRAASARGGDRTDDGRQPAGRPPPRARSRLPPSRTGRGSAAGGLIL
jgi:hypothetical protein